MPQAKIHYFKVQLTRILHVVIKKAFYSEKSHLTT